MDQQHTEAYFDEHCPEYSTARLEWAAGRIAALYGPDASLLDLGCGAGNTLAWLRERTGIRHVAGLDSSSRQLERVRERLGCPTYQASQASALSPDLRTVVPLAAVLHHLVCRTRQQSQNRARQAMANVMGLVRPDGCLVVVEPVFHPRAPIDVLFHLKQGVSVVSSQRVTIGGPWNNIGPPVVSYLTEPQLLRMLAVAGGRAVEAYREERPLPRIMRLAGINSRREVTIIGRPAVPVAGDGDVSSARGALG